MQVKLSHTIGQSTILLTQQVDLGCGRGAYIEVYGKCALIRICDQPPLAYM